MTPIGPILQTAFVTDDIKASMATLSRDFGAGPWFWRERGVFPRQTYLGQPVQTALSIAMAYAGGMLYELIQQLDDSPSVYQGASGQRLHHFGVPSADYDASLAACTGRGYQLVYEAEVANGARVGYFDTVGALPAMIEVIEFLPATQAMFARFRAAHEGWDGSDPVRPLIPVKT
ncbi:MAG: VOC family protein [Gemmobacter sp.]|nr:VOC family protein [Gemmobacter sp.]